MNDERGTNDCLSVRDGGGTGGGSEGGRVEVVERYYKLQRYKKVPMDEQIKIQMIKWQTP